MPSYTRYLAVALASASSLVTPLIAQSHSDRPARFESRMFRFDPAHSGVAETEGVPTFGGVAWTFETEGPVRSTPALGGGVLYFGSGDGSLYAVRADDGSLRWRFHAGAPVLSSPAITDRVVIFGDRNNTVRALDRADGHVVWEMRTGRDADLPWGLEGWDYVTASPVLVSAPGGGTYAVFGGGDGDVHAVDAETGEVAWRFETTQRIRSTPAVAGDLVYFGGGDGVVYALELASGKERWRHTTTGAGLDAADFGFDRRQIQASPAVVDGTVYLGSRDASLYALDAQAGEVRWHREDGSAWVVGSAAVAGGRLFNGRSSSGRFRAVDIQSGAEEWVVNTGGTVFSSPVLVGDVVYVGSGSAFLYALQAETGAVRWRFVTGGPIHSSPVVADGRVYIGSDDGSVYAIKGGSLAKPHLAVFFDDSLKSRSAWGSAPGHQVVRDYFQRRGYSALDASGLAEFMKARAADRAPSAIVFGMDALPKDVAESAADTVLIRKYLRAGGKVVWMGYPPFALARDSAGAFLGLDHEGAGAFTGVDLTPWNTDSYYARPTPTGQEWGLERWAMVNPSAEAASVDVVLARDEFGGAAAWVKTFGGPPGTGFVFVPATTDPRRLDEIRRVAEYGLMQETQSYRR